MVRRLRMYRQQECVESRCCSNFTPDADGVRQKEKVTEGIWAEKSESLCERNLTVGSKVRIRFSGVPASGSSSHLF